MLASKAIHGDIAPGRRIRFERLAQRMASFWEPGRPSGLSTTDFAVYTKGILDIEEPPEILRHSLRRARLLDLGAGGPASFLPMAHFATMLDASEFTIVDRYQDYSNAEHAMREFINHRYPGIALNAVNEDMLCFLARAPHESANISMNGIDEHILRGEPDVERMYVLALLGQIARVVPVGGVAFGVCSPFLCRLGEYGFTAHFDGAGTMMVKGAPQ